MNHLNKDIITQILAEILTENPQFLCFTDHRQLNILAWKSKKATNALILKIGDKKFFASPRTDKKGQEYWKFHPLTSEEKVVEEQAPLTNPTNYETSNPNQSSNSSG